MPTIFFHGPKLDKEKKAKLAEAFTATASELTGLPKESIVVYVKDTDPESVAVGGVLVSDLRR